MCFQKRNDHSVNPYAGNNWDKFWLNETQNYLSENYNFNPGFVLSCSTCKPIQKPIKTIITVAGQLTFTQNYCKGIAPTPEELAEFSRPEPVITKSYVRRGPPLAI